MKTYIIPTTKTLHLVKKFTKIKDLEVLFLEKNKDKKNNFPEQEFYLKIPRIKDIKGRVVVLHSGQPSPNEGLIELEMILEILKTNKNIKCEVFFSYFPYGQQDEVFEKGELNMAESIVKKLLGYYKVKKIYIIDAHFFNKGWIKKYPIKNILPLDLFKEKVLKQTDDIIFLSPDEGAEKRTGLEGAKKKRQDSYNVTARLEKKLENKIKGKTVVVVDDIIETGGTLIRFYNNFLKGKAKKSYVFVTHGALEQGIEKIKKTYDKVYLTNSIDTKHANLDISNLVIKSIK